MISTRTQLEVGRNIEQWAKKHKVSKKAVHELVAGLAAIDGNKSYRDSTAGLLILVESMKW